MPLQLNRRTAIRGGLAALALGSGGCSALGVGTAPDLTLALVNLTDRTQNVRVQLLREDADTRDAALVHDTAYDIAPSAASEDMRMEEDIVPSRRYVVRVTDANTVDSTTHYHFYPEDCTGDGEPEEVLYVELHRYPADHSDSGLYFDFTQNIC